MIEHPEETPDPGDAGDHETATLPLSIVGGQPLKEGDVVKLKVISVDSNGGTFEAAYARPEKPGGINKMAAAFDEPTPPMNGE